MPHSLRARLSGLRYKKIISDKDYDRLCKALDNENVLDKIRAEIEKAVWEDVVVSLDGMDEVRIPCLNPDDVFEIIDKYKAESEEV